MTNKTADASEWKGEKGIKGERKAFIIQKCDQKKDLSNGEKKGLPKRENEWGGGEKVWSPYPRGNTLYPTHPTQKGGGGEPHGWGRGVGRKKKDKAMLLYEREPA